MLYTKEFAEKILELCPWANAVAVDMDGKGFWYEGTPKCGLMENLEYNWWIAPSNNNAKGFIGRFELDMDWKDTLVEKKWMPKINERVFISDPSKDELYYPAFFNDHRISQDYLQKELIYKTQAEAIEASKKMLKAIEK